MKKKIEIQEIEKVAESQEASAVLKKTAEAYGTISEEKALEEAASPENVSKKLIEKAFLEEEELLEIERKKKVEKIEEEDRKVEEAKKDFFRGNIEKRDSLTGWDPKTRLGKEVKEGKIRNIDEILDSGKKILEPEIIDFMITVKSDLLLIGQSKGKFGGGKRRAWRQTQKKRKEGNVPTFSAFAVVGDENGHVGVGVGKAKETLPARDKSTKKAKLNLIKITRACASFDCDCDEKHTVPFIVEGKAGSSRVRLIPAPQGTGLVVANELKKILKLAGIKDVYSKTFGTQRTTFNFAKACIDALKKTNDVKRSRLK